MFYTQKDSDIDENQLLKGVRWSPFSIRVADFIVYTQSVSEIFYE